MPFKKLDNHTLILLVIGVVVILASAGLAAWLYQTSPNTASTMAQPNTVTTVQGKALPPEHAHAIGLPTKPNLKPMPKAWDEAMQAINPNGTPPDGNPVAKADKTLQALETPKYVANAEAGVAPGAMLGQRPKIAIVIDDVGVHSALSRKADAVLPPEVTFAFLPYGSVTKELAKKARKEGREVMIHLPMEPMPRLDEPPIDPGPNALYVELSPEEIRKRTRLNLKDLKDISVGVNNHMGSRFTSYEEGMKEVLKIIDEEGLFFMDSLTTSESAVADAAKAAAPNMPLLKRDIFLDHYITEEALTKALLRLEEEAKANGKAIAIGHPHGRTLSVLQDWLPTLPFKGIDLVPISHMLASDSKPFEPTTVALPEGVTPTGMPPVPSKNTPSENGTLETLPPIEPMHVINPEERHDNTGLY